MLLDRATPRGPAHDVHQVFCGDAGDSQLQANLRHVLWTHAFQLGVECSLGGSDP